MTNRPTRVDWDAAKAFYVALPPHERTYATVGRQFGVSENSVGKWAKRGNWAAAAAEADRKAGAQQLRVAERTRADRAAQVARLRDAATDELERRLTHPEQIETPVLSRLVELTDRLYRLDTGEATDRVQIADVQPVLSAFARIAVLEAAPERRAEVMRLLEAASAGLVALPAGEAA